MRDSICSLFQGKVKDYAERGLLLSKNSPHLKGKILLTLSHIHLQQSIFGEAHTYTDQAEILFTELEINFGFQNVSRKRLYTCPTRINFRRL